MRSAAGKRFRVAFSFAGEKRDYVAAVAATLAARFGEAAILYDKYHEAEFARRDLGHYLPSLYHSESDLIVVVVCRDYEEKEWCGLEWDAIFDLLKKRKNEEIMLCRFDHATVRGLFSTAGFVELDHKSTSEAASSILERLALNEGKARDYYLETMRAVAVEGAYDPDQGDVRDTELAQLILDVPALAPRLKSLLDDAVPPERGFAAFAVRVGDPLPSLVHVSVRCAHGPAFVGAPSNADTLWLRLAGDASAWVAQYIRRFRGRLRNTFERTASFPLFSLPDGHYDSPGQLRAAMSVAYLACVIDDALRYDLSLPVEFPETLMVCAAGSGEEGGPAAGADHWVEAVYRERWPNPATVWHPAQPPHTVRDTPPLPPTVKLVPVDGVEQMARSLLEEFEAFLPHSAAPAAISGVMRRGLAELHTIETLIEVASQEALSKQVRLERMEEEIAVRERQVRWLNDTGQQVRERLRKRRSVPPPAKLLDQFTQLEEEAHKPPVAQPGVVVVPSDFEEKSDRCVFLYRRLARFYHPDVQPDVRPAESEMFLQLVSHRWDLVWLEALDGAIDPLRVETTATDIERRVDVLVDRLYALRDAAERVDGKVAAKDQELQSLGGRTTAALDEEIQSRRAVLSILEHDIDRGWRTLNYAAGWDRAGR